MPRKHFIIYARASLATELENYYVEHSSNLRQNNDYTVGHYIIQDSNHRPFFATDTLNY